MEFSIDNNINEGAVIKVIGVGGGGGNATVSYKPLTLPAERIVEISVGGGACKKTRRALTEREKQM